jgi:hypothetical protein
VKHWAEIGHLITHNFPSAESLQEWVFHFLKHLISAGVSFSEMWKLKCSNVIPEVRQIQHQNMEYQMLTYFDKLTFLGLLVPQLVVFYLSSPLCQNAKFPFLHSQILNFTLPNCKLHNVSVTLPICQVHFIFQAAQICFRLACPKKLLFCPMLKFHSLTTFFFKCEFFFLPYGTYILFTRLPTHYLGYLPNNPFRLPAFHLPTWFVPTSYIPTHLTPMYESTHLVT